MTSVPLIDLEEKKPKPTWEAYQVSWADVNYNKLLPILAWNDNNNGKEKQGKEPTCRTTINTWTNDKDHYKLTPILLELTPSWKWEKSNKEKEKVKEEEPLPTNPYTSDQYTTPQQFTYH
ncbi:hypothetical protein G9A89_022028 [Geosiphon pyriformis]|nr:hypothetical protein G9A89_022028 [Geosiphon pyriformis]